MTHKQAGMQAAWGDTPGGSYFNTFNPVSNMFGYTDRVPEWWMNLFPRSMERAGHMAFKLGSIALLTTALVGGARALSHLNRVSDIAEKDKPGKKLKSQIGTTFELDKPEDKKQAKEAASFNYPDILSWDTAVGSVLPVGTAILAAIAAYKGVDSAASKRRNRLLDEAVKSKSDAVMNLMRTRARLARGIATPAEIRNASDVTKDEDIFVKHAKDDGPGFLEMMLRGGTAATGLVATALLALSAVGAYSYFSATDTENLKFKAFKRGLEDYARAKSGMTPITIVPENTKEFFKGIDVPADKNKKEQKPRELPSYNPDELNKPISITL